MPPWLTTTLAILGSVLGLASFVWNIFNYIAKYKGKLHFKIICSKEQSEIITDAVITTPQKWITIEVTNMGHDPREIKQVRCFVKRVTDDSEDIIISPNYINFQGAKLFRGEVTTLGNSSKCSTPKM